MVKFKPSGKLPFPMRNGKEEPKKTRGNEMICRDINEENRDWGYNAIYRPTLARSKKRQLMEALGGKNLRRVIRLIMMNR